MHRTNDGITEETTDVVIVGGGIAGLYTALKLAPHVHVTLLLKGRWDESSSVKAQGGIAAVLSPSDDPKSHARDTKRAGAGLCRSESVRILTEEGRAAVEDLIRYGTRFDRTNGEWALTREGAHSHRRILHANGDSTGAEVIRALCRKVERHANITIRFHHFVTDVIVYDGVCHGCFAIDAEGAYIRFSAHAVILATGGAGRLFQHTTNPVSATGDGVAIAYRAGARVQDMEFYQFHPTVFCHPGAPRFLISEAVRGEGAVLRNRKGERFMESVHPLKELAPRDVVARAIMQQMKAEGSTAVYLDIRHESKEHIQRRFPMINHLCRRNDYDLTRDWIPVAPAAHYSMGGVQTNTEGASSVSRLYAVGETACTGVHGANRLASNSLLEAVVFGRRTAEHVLKHFKEPVQMRTISSDDLPSVFETVEERRRDLQRLMSMYAGVERSEAGLKKVWNELEYEWTSTAYFGPDRTAVEWRNLLTCARLMVRAALYREESRGGHYRTDVPERNDALWQMNIIQQAGRELWKEDVCTYDEQGQMG